MKLIAVFVLLAIPLVFRSLNAQIQNVYKVGQTGIKSTDGMVLYSLPRTVISVNVVAQKKIILRGPYFEFAEEFLGVKGISTENKTDWSIDNFDIQSVVESDPEAMFALQVSKGFNTDRLLKMTKAGLICEMSGFANIKDGLALNDTSSEFLSLDEYSIKGFESESFDTLYKTILKDTVFVKIPVLKPKTSVKTLRDRAKEAADIIYKIRQRRFELLMSEDEAFTEVNVLKYALSELQKIENNYLELFVGKKVMRNYSSSFYFTPLALTAKTKQELFRFSKNIGFIQKGDSSSYSVFISIENPMHLKALQDWVTSIPLAGKNQMYYRIPEAADVKIEANGQVVAAKRLLINQFGAIVPYSVK